FGIRALVRGQERGRTLTVGAVAASIDGVIELVAKLPYVLSALLTLLALAPQPRLTHLLSMALAATAVVVILLLFALQFARPSLSASLEAMARAITARWPAMLSLEKDGLTRRDLRACFDGILSQRRRLWAGFTLHLCCWYLGAAEVWVTFRLL